MVKRLFVFFSILCAALVLGSCSDSLENKSSLAFEVSEAFFRNVVGDSVSTDGSGQTSYTVKVTVSWEKDQNMVQEQSATVNDSGEVSCPTFTFKDLPTGKTVSVDVSIYSGNVLVYKTETPVEKQLVAGENNCTVGLTKCVSNVVISIQNKGEIKLDSAKEYKLRVTLSGEYERTSEWTLTSADNTFSVENLDIGKSVKLDVAVYSGNLCVYKIESPVPITIAEKNEIAVTLENAISTAAVWMNKISYQFCQSKRYDSAETEFKGNFSYYTFDSDGNLWIVMSAPAASESKVTFYEYVMDSGLYTTTEDGNPYKTYTMTIGANQSIVDIYWDNSILYALVKNSNSNTPVFYLNSYTIKGEDLSAGLSSLQINLPSEDTTSPSLSTLAVNDSKVIVGAEDSASVFMNYIVDEKFVSSEFSVVGSFNISGLTDTGNICVTDLQFGDGLGNYVDKIYALVRNYTSSFDNTASVVYSNGALVDIDIESVSYKLHGYEGISKSVKLSTNSEAVFYAPSDSDSNNFFGPTKFVALVPKKLVILDDGISFTEGINGIASASNNDNLFEFDIATSSIKKGISVTASVPYASSISKDWN